MFKWFRKLLDGFIKTPTKSEGLDKARVDNQVGEKVVRNRRKVSTKKSDSVAKPTRIRSNNASKTGGKSSGKTVRATANKSKTKSKAVSKG